MPDLRERVLNGIVGVIAGGLISLLTLAPSSLISDTDKWILGVVIFFLFVIAIIYQYGKDIIDENRENAELARRYLNILPKTVRFDEYRRTVEVTEEGDAVVDDKYRVSNMGEDPIPTLSIPQFCDIYEDIDVLFERNGPNVPIELDQPDSFVNLLQLKIGEESIPTEQAYNRKGYLIGDRVFEEKGQQKISFGAIGDLQPEHQSGQSTVNIGLKYKADGGLDKALTGEGDYIACDCLHPTDSMKLVIHPPDGYDITLYETDSNPEAIEVKDIHGKIQDTHERSTVSKPRQTHSERLEWEIENPKVNYRYIIHFQCLQVDDDAGVV